ncbi:hypothetical protein [Brachybacterium sp. NPDC056505]|uniref:hypothetical protein n=1 Tax=Brachybacterium sp. NPDC056505 TaxID=3345843 RepID=UPI00366BFF09
MHQVYGADLGGPIIHERTWRWLSVRIVQLLTETTTRLHRAIYGDNTRGTSGT